MTDAASGSRNCFATTREAVCNEEIVRRKSWGELERVAVSAVKEVASEVGTESPETVEDEAFEFAIVVDFVN